MFRIDSEIGKAIWEAMAFVILGDDLSQEAVEELGNIMIEFGFGILSVPVDLPFTTYRKALAAKSKFHELFIQEYKRRMAISDHGYNRKDLLILK